MALNARKCGKRALAPGIAREIGPKRRDLRVYLRLLRCFMMQKENTDRVISVRFQRRPSDIRRSGEGLCRLRRVESRSDSEHGHRSRFRWEWILRPQ